MVKKLLTASILLLAIFGFASRVLADTPLTSDDCGHTLSSAGETYTLQSNMSCPDSGLIIGADGITIDGNGKTLSSTNFGSGALAIEGGNHKNITIENFGEISNFESSIVFIDSPGPNTIESNVFSNTSAISLVRASRVTIRDNHFVNNGLPYLSIENVDYGTTTRNTFDGATEAMVVSSSTNLEITHNNFTHNGIGLGLGADQNNAYWAGVGPGSGKANSNIVQYNTFTSNNRIAIGIGGSSNNLISDNVMDSNSNDIITIDKDGGPYSTGNTFADNKLGTRGINSRMITFNETVPVTRIRDVGEPIDFQVSLFDASGNPCTAETCEYTISTSPAEPSLNTDDIDDGVVVGQFTPTKPGTYSLVVDLSDSSGNTDKKNYKFFVGTLAERTTLYFLRGDNFHPAHGQPSGSNDGKALLLSKPSVAEEWSCGSWIQNSIDELPEYPLASLSSTTVSSFYKTVDESSNDGFYGIARFVIFNNDSVDRQSEPGSVPVSSGGYSLFSTDFSDLNWAMDYPSSWYWLTLKYQSGDSPHWYTSPTQLSYADFTYQYTTTPAIKTISNDNVNVLSATASSTNASSTSIVLDNENDEATSTALIITAANRAYQNAVSTITADATTTLEATVSANSTLTLNSVPLDITPDAGTVEVAITAWNTSGNYAKEWTEKGDETIHSASHTVGDLKSLTAYDIAVDGATTTTATTTADGVLTFDHTGYSTHTFTITEYVPPAEISEEPTITPPLTPTHHTFGSIVRHPISVIPSAPSLSLTLPSTLPPPTFFTQPLHLGLTNPNVKSLQIFLNTHGFVVSTSGAGSLGHETNYFGQLTKQALGKFQLQNKLITSPQDPAFGYLGPKTRTLVNTYLN